MPPVGKEIPTGGPKRRETISFYFRFIVLVALVQTPVPVADA